MKAINAYLCIGIKATDMRKRPQPLSYSLTRRFLEETVSAEGRQFFLNNELSIIQGSSLPFQLLKQMDAPFCINDYRIGLVVQGAVRSIVNLTERHVQAGDIILLGPGTIVQPLAVSSDLSVKGMVVLPDFPLPFSPTDLPTFNGQQSFRLMHPDETDLAIANQLLDAMWNIARLHYDSGVMGGLVKAIFSHWNRMFVSQTATQPAAPTREQAILERFLRLVNQHAAHQHQIHFYADRLCLTDRYLGTVVHQASGVTAKEWIDRALVMAIKVKLRHTDLSLKQIADEMAFPNASFFCKFFRRMTGLSPGDFRERGERVKSRE